MKTFNEWILLEKSGESYKLSCVMASFEKNISDKIIKWGKQHIPDKVLHKDKDGGMGREDEIHVTALYGLHTNEVKSVEKITKDIKSFEIKLGKISKFESPDFDVIKIEISGKKLYDLNKSLKTLDYTSKFKDYVPHCTIAYVKKGTCDHLLDNKNFVGNESFITSLIFSPAEGEKQKINLV